MATHRLDGWFWIENHTCHMVFDWGVSTLRVVKGTFINAAANRRAGRSHHRADGLVHLVRPVSASRCPLGAATQAIRTRRV
jgi:hypothetical protein